MARRPLIATQFPCLKSLPVHVIVQGCVPERHAETGRLMGANRSMLFGQFLPYEQVHIWTMEITWHLSLICENIWQFSGLKQSKYADKIVWHCLELVVSEAIIWTFTGIHYVVWRNISTSDASADEIHQRVEFESVRVHGIFEWRR